MVRRFYLSIFALCACLWVCAPLHAETATTLYEHQEGDPDVAVNWSKTTERTIDASAFVSAQVGDFVQVTVMGTGNIQCILRDQSTHDQLINTATYANTSSAENVYRYGLTAAGLTAAQTNGCYLAGANCNLLKIELISTSSTDNFTDVVWFGSKVCSWNGVQLAAANYASVEEGWTLRVHHTDLGANPRLGLYNAYTEAITGHDYAAVSGDYTDITVDAAMLEVMATGNFFVRGNAITLTKIEVFSPMKTVDVETTLYEGTSALTNWSRNYEQPASVYNNLVAGDVLKVTLSGNANDNTNCQLRISWGANDGKYVAWTDCYSKGFPYTYELELTAEQVTAIKTAKALYLGGCNIIVSSWTLTHQKTVSHDRGNAITSVWTGSQSINWSGTNEWLRLEGSAFSAIKAGDRLRICFANMKNGAQGRIVDGTWTTIADANTYEKLPSDWGDYFEYTVTAAMATTLQTNGLVVSGVGYTATAIQIIDPMREYVITASFDESDIRAWELSDGTPNLTVTLTNHEDIAVNTSVDISLSTDMFVDYNTYSLPVELAAGETKTVSLEMPDLVPGFYRMRAQANNNAVCNYVIGYNPTAIVSPYDAQPDFWSFWNTWLNRLADIPIDAELTLLEGEESDARNIYEVKYKSVPETVGGEPVFIYGYYAEPKAEGSYPCIIHFHGTDKSGNLTKPSATETDWCEFRFSARGQTLDKAKNGSEKYRTNPEDESSVDFYAYRLGDNDEHYYRYVYLDTRRAVDFVASQAKVNEKNIFAVGGSQGGCLTYVCAALSEGKIRAIAPSITGHADFVHTMEIVGWPTNVFNNWINAKVADGTYATYEAGKAALLQHQSYFDTKNFAPYITCPVITNFSLQDNTDGPHLNIAPYNLLNVADKEYSINPFKGHATANDWGTTYMNFFNARLYEEPLVPTALLNVSAAGMATYVLPFAVPTLPIGVEAYRLTNSGEETIAAERVNALEEDKPVLIVAEEGVYTFEGEAGGSDDVSAKTSTYSNGALIGTYKTIVPLAQTDGAGNYNYILNNGADGVAFYQVLDGGCSVAPYRAYLSCGHNANASGPGLAPKKSMRIVFHQDSTTDMETITGNRSPLTVTKVLRNGQLFIIRNGVEYTINGQMVK